MGSMARLTSLRFFGTARPAVAKASIIPTEDANPISSKVGEKREKKKKRKNKRKKNSPGKKRTLGRTGQCSNPPFDLIPRNKYLYPHAPQNSRCDGETQRKLGGAPRAQWRLLETKKVMKTARVVDK